MSKFESMKRITLVFGLVFGLLVPISGSAVAAVTWSQTSKLDVVFDGKFYNSQYDLQYTSAYIFDNETDKIYFYFLIRNRPLIRVNFIVFDYNF